MPTPSVSSEVSELFSPSTESSPLKRAISFSAALSISTFVVSVSTVFVTSGFVTVSEEVYTAIPKPNNNVKINPTKAIVVSPLVMPASMMHKNNIKRITANIATKVVVIIFISYFLLSP